MCLILILAQLCVVSNHCLMTIPPPPSALSCVNMTMNLCSTHVLAIKAFLIMAIIKQCFTKVGGKFVALVKNKTCYFLNNYP